MNLTPLDIRFPLSSERAKCPQFAVNIKDRMGNDITCADPAVTKALIALMDLGAVNGGAACHWGGPAALAEAMSALFTIMFKEARPWESYHFVNDVGHAENGLYALKANWQVAGLTLNDLKGFRSITSKLTGHGESHLFPEGVLLSNGPLGSAVPQAQGLAMADKLLGNNRTTICVVSDGACMEGETREALAAIPALAQKGKINPFVLILSDNNTKLSGRIDKDAYSMRPSFAAMSALGWQVMEVGQGNSLGHCYHNIDEALRSVKTDKPILVWLKTVKGHGVKKTEESASGGHGFPIKAYSDEIFAFIDEIFKGNTPPFFKHWAQELLVKPDSKSSASKSEIPSLKAQAGLAKGAIKARQKGLPVVSVSSDLQGSTGMSDFHKEFPDSSIDIGIAESNMVSVAAGMSKLGLIPIVDTFAAFGVTKGNLPFIMASLSSCPMIAVFSHTGFQDAADGASHQSLTYMSAIAAIPHVRAICVSTSDEGEALMLQAIETIAEDRIKGHTPNSYIFFVGRENFPKYIKPALKYTLEDGQLLEDGKDGVIVATGPMVFKALKAQEILKNEHKKELSVINLPCVNHPDYKLVKNSLDACKRKLLITVEDHQLIGGMGQMLTHALKQAGSEFELKSLGVKEAFGRSAYSADELYKLYGIDEQHIVDAGA